MIKAELTKLETRADARLPQEDRYPSGMVRVGTLERLPVIGKGVSLIGNKIGKLFRTSVVEDIEELSDKEWIITTVNSMYKIEFK